MLKKSITVWLGVVMVLVLLTGCSGNSGGTAGNTTDSGLNTGDNASKTKAGKVTLKIFQFKVEIAEAMNRMAADYEKETGVKVAIETVGGGADYGAALKAKLAAGEEPDIFNNNGFNLLDPYMDRATELTDQPWISRVPDVAKQPMLRDGKVYGMPMTLEGHGLIYNIDLFAKAGITTKPTTLAELSDAMKKLKDAGIQPIANGFGEWWVLNQYLGVATALHPDPIQFSKDVTEGKIKISEDPIFRSWISFLDLVLKYSNDNPLTTDYNSQVTMFASGKAAMMGQGNWTQVQIDGIDPKLNIGLIAIPAGDTPELSGYITSGVPNNWVVNKKGAHPEEAKQFLNWMVSTDIGKRYIIKEFKFIPALTDIPYQKGDLGSIAEAVLEYINNNKAKTWSQQYPETYDKEFGASMQAYVAKKITSEQLLKQFDEAIQKLVKK
jgi:raffinose/stachyose/melibiose transport system substrate-binding protein